jgi:hypothetical protein
MTTTEIEITKALQQVRKPAGHHSRKRVLTTIFKKCNTAPDKPLTPNQGKVLLSSLHFYRRQVLPVYFKHKNLIDHQL